MEKETDRDQDGQRRAEGNKETGREESYDRGWQVEPSGSPKLGVCRTMGALLPSLPLALPKAQERWACP